MTIRKTYELPTPSKTGYNYSSWFTNHPIEVDGDIDNCGDVLRFRRRGTVSIAIHEDGDLELNYDDAERVALAILAAVEEAKANH